MKFNQFGCFISTVSGWGTRTYQKATIAHDHFVTNLIKIQLLMLLERATDLKR